MERYNYVWEGVWDQDSSDSDPAFRKQAFDTHTHTHTTHSHADVMYAHTDTHKNIGHRVFFF